MSIQIRHRNLLRLIGVYTLRGKPTILSKAAIQFYLHVGRQRIMSTQIRHCNLLRLIGVYIPCGKPTILSKTAIQFCLVGRQRIIFTQIRRRNLLGLIVVYTLRGKPTILSKTAIQIYLCWDAANNVYPDQMPNRGLHHRPRNQQFSTK